MGFKQADNQGRGGYVKVWKVEDKGNYSVAQVSSSKKDRDGNYETDFTNNFVRFVGNAHTAIQQQTVGSGGLSIQITSCEVTNKYDKGKNITYTNYTVFDFDVPNGNGGGGNKKNASSGKASAKKPVQNEAPADDDDDDLPF